MKICIVGTGKTGSYISESLVNSGNELIVADIDEERIENAGSMLDAYTVRADGLIVNNLTELGVGNCDVLIAATENDEKNMIICILAKYLGCSRTIARVREPEHMGQFDDIKKATGIDKLINPDFECAHEICKYLTEQYAINGGYFSKDGISILEFQAKEMPLIIGKKLMECGPYFTNMLAAAISRSGKIIIPNGSSEIQADDVIYIAGSEMDINRLASKTRTKTKTEMPKRVMIAGGGKTALFLARELLDKGIAVRIIEKNRDRCIELSSKLDRATILCGDASDIQVLREEGLESMDAFVACTGFDEENLLLSLLVRRYGVKDIAVKISHDTYKPLIDEMDNAAVINPQLIVANNILKYVQNKDILLFSQTINGQAEFREIQADSSMPLCKKPLINVNIPEGVIILAVHRGKNIIIPNGRTQITAGDRVLLLSLLSCSGDLESLFTKTQSTLL